MFPLRDHNPSGRRPYVTIALVVLNLLVFAITYAAVSDQQAAEVWYRWGMIPARILAGEGWPTLLTHMFLHGGWMHLIGNLLFLWIFGDNLEDQMGHGGFALFYLASGLAAAALEMGMAPGSYVPMVGASGAIAGVMGGYLLLFPRAQVDVLIVILVFFRVFTVPAWVLLGGWILLQFFAGLEMPSEEDGVAYWAHVGGFVAGAALTLPFWLARGGRGYWRRNDGHPPHAGAEYPMAQSRIPKVRR
ncbi:rhomboid family intramembrane serine protease [Pseudogemmobacter sonorensis]|uniref:rhomboid family intramembrane serine protease n=1 Tax=Pseudogemmobacter sonorensis TaxID=2989681 RepID=UPI0036BE71B6